MHCPNCDRELIVDDGQFCPYCGAPVDVVEWPKKKKNDQNRDFGWDNLVMTGILYMVAPVLLMLFIAPRPLSINSFLAYGGGGLAVSLVIWFLANNQQCSRCHRFFSMKHYERREIGRKKIYKVYHNQQMVVLRINCEDSFRCSNCGHEKKLVRYEDHISLIE